MSSDVVDALTGRVADAFADGGALHAGTAHFIAREGQTAMALAVAETIDAGGVLVVEAGTGVGKTFSYLVPALLSGERVLVSTATKTLQDQLFSRDLPLLVEALGVAVRTALLKGRGSYLCLHRMELARRDGDFAEPGMLRSLARIERWAQGTRSGDLGELPGLDDRSPVLPLVTSTRENCLGAQCPQARACHVNQARREAMAADVVVINHHLFFADLAVRESGVAELLPTVRVVVFDEAHQLNETGVQFLGRQLGSGQLIDFARDMLAAGLQGARGLADWQEEAAAVEHAARDLRLALGRARPGSKLRWAGQAPEQADALAWANGLVAVAAACRRSAVALDTVSEIGPDFGRLQTRALLLAERAEAFAQACPAGSVRWADVGSHVRLVESPLDIADAVRTRLLGLPTGPAPEPGDTAGARVDGRAWIFTSATLGDDPRLRWFTEPCGLEGARVLRVSSPFDYARQAALYVPRQLPLPADAGHPAAVAALAAQGAAALGGRTLVLTTTLRSLRSIGDALRERFPPGGKLEVLVQGEGPKRRLMERFREGSSHGDAGCVLVASASFWEGVDVPGDALQLVVIDKLPFPPPGDPLVQARAERLERSGRSPFNAYFVPEAAVALKQGAGRLIRRESDRGILVVGDARLRTMAYGRRLMTALPPMRVLESPEAYAQALAGLTTPSTTDPNPP